MGPAKQFFDDVAYERSDVGWEKTERRFRRVGTCEDLKAFVEKYFSKPCKLGKGLVQGSYNVIYRMHLEGRDGKAGEEVIVRIPCPGIVKFPDEKTMAEVATMRCISENTTIPIPFLHTFELSKSSPTDLGPVLMIDFVENSGSFSVVSDDPNRKDQKGPPTLDPNISETRLRRFYDQMTAYFLQLSKLEFPRIGSLLLSDDGGSGLDRYSVQSRPLSANMNCLLDLANVPPCVLPPSDTTYGTSDEWYTALADMHMAHLVFQHNDLVYALYDCYNKYVARQLFRKLAKEGKLSTFGFAEDTWSAQARSGLSSSMLSAAPSKDGPFRLWGDDLRGGNILVDDALDVKAIIDWEFAYVGPTQFSLDPPWWLLLEEPECWEDGLDEWSKEYERRLDTWLRSMERAEQTEAADAGVRMSKQMRESWETGRFWLNYASRKSWSFDAIYWKYLDERFFGPRGDVPDYDWWESRLDLLSDIEKTAMYGLASQKMRDKEERILVDWEPDRAKRHLDQFMIPVETSLHAA